MTTVSFNSAAFNSVVTIKFRGQGESLTLSQNLQRVRILKVLNSSETVESLLERLKAIEAWGITPYAYCDNCLLDLSTGELVPEKEGEPLAENVAECIYLSALPDGTEGHPGNIWNLPCLLVAYEGEEASETILNKENFVQLFASGDWTGIIKTPTQENTEILGHVLNPRVFKILVDRESELPGDWERYVGKTKEEYMEHIEFAVLEIDQNGHALFRGYPVIIPRDLDVKEIESMLKESIEWLNQYPLDWETEPRAWRPEERAELEDEFIKCIESGGKFPRTLEFTVRG